VETPRKFITAVINLHSTNNNIMFYRHANLQRTYYRVCVKHSLPRGQSDSTIAVTIIIQFFRVSEDFRVVLIMCLIFGVHLKLTYTVL
jgi:hypothetical protein